jgi:hypothetical protein
MKSWVALGVFVSGLVGACAGQAPREVTADSAPDIEDVGLGEQTDGTTYNGWSMSVYGQFPTYNLWYIQYVRSYGDALRGGGACLVLSDPGTSCSNDADCTAPAHARWGGSAYGYCHQAKCNYRPGSPAELCTQSPSRAPGIHWGNTAAVMTQLMRNMDQGGIYGMSVLGCMSKEPGPNTQCGSTDSNVYMRTVSQMIVDIPTGP